MTEELNFAQEMEQLLDQHDYGIPQVGDIRKGIIVSVSQQGLIVDLGLKQDSIVPSTDLEKLEPGEREALQVGDEIPVYITSTEQPDNIASSVFMARLNEDWVKAQEMLDSQEVFETEIIGYNKGGAIVPFGRLRGFIPLSHLGEVKPEMNDRQRQQRLAKLRGQKVPVKVIEVDRRRRRLVMSQREAEKIWQEMKRKEFMATVKEGDVLPGRVTGWRDFGVFVNVGGTEGLIHVSELAWHRVNHPREVVAIGDEFEVIVLKVNKDEERISLSRRKLMANPWVTINERYTQGQLTEGKIIRIVDYGAFVELEPGVEGLLHNSQLSRNMISNPNEVVNEGERHLLRVISVDSGRQRIGLSLKAVTAKEQIEWMAQLPDLLGLDNNSQLEASPAGESN